MNEATSTFVPPFSASSLMRAVAARNIRGIEKYIHQSGKRDAEGRTALMYAASTGYVEGVRLLIAPPPKFHGLRAYFEEAPSSELRMRDKHGETALHAATHAKSHECVAILAPLEHSIRTGGNLTALMLAALADDADSALLLVKYESEQESCGETALMMAVRAISYKVVPVLVPFESGMFVCESGKFGPIAAFAQLESYEPFDMVVDGQQLLAKMNDEPPKWSALMRAADAGDMLMVRFLAGRERGMQDPITGETALMRCLDALLGQVSNLEKSEFSEQEKASGYILELQEVALFLASIPEETGKRDMQGKTALMRACACRHYGAEIARRVCLIEHMHVDESGLGCSDYTGTDEHMEALILAAKSSC